MPSFRHLKSVIRLNELAEDPVDLTEDGILTPKRIEAMQAHACGLKLFFGTERISDLTLNALFELAEETEALKKMTAMQSGEIVNFIEGYESEKRPALHTAMRDFFEHRHTPHQQKKRLNWPIKN